ncbi:MAG TPA: hypothetical protein VGO40_03380 [Longimicrobium sp.]|jgi:hypothetical protein|nr:hypothetical protein [Longimicrobium sp.]
MADEGASDGRESRTSFILVKGDRMSRRVINFAAAALILASTALLGRPARAADFQCTEDQWALAESIINEVCEGGSFTLTCNGNVMHLTLVACAPGNR